MYFDQMVASWQQQYCAKQNKKSWICSRRFILFVIFSWVKCEHGTLCQKKNIYKWKRMKTHDWHQPQKLPVSPVRIGNMFTVGLSRAVVARALATGPLRTYLACGCKCKNTGSTNTGMSSNIWPQFWRSKYAFLLSLVPMLNADIGVCVGDSFLTIGVSFTCLWSLKRSFTKVYKMGLLVMLIDWNQCATLSKLCWNKRQDGRGSTAWAPRS